MDRTRQATVVPLVFRLCAKLSSPAASCSSTHLQKNPRVSSLYQCSIFITQQKSLYSYCAECLMKGNYSNSGITSCLSALVSELWETPSLFGILHDMTLRSFNLLNVLMFTPMPRGQNDKERTFDLFIFYLLSCCLFLYSAVPPSVALLSAFLLAGIPAGATSE